MGDSLKMSLPSAIGVRHARCKYLSVHVKKSYLFPSFIQRSAQDGPVLGLKF